MAKGRPGADSSTLVSNKINGKNLIQLAADLFGEMPLFWGRYFKSTFATGNVEYRHALENGVLHQNNVRVLPIARQTLHVDGTEDLGSADAVANVDDLLSTFGVDYLSSLGGEFFMFLDVEGQPSLSTAYYTGWAQTLMSHSLDASGNALTILPCVYGPHSDNTTWNAIQTCAGSGVPCEGIWVARYVRHNCTALIDWNKATVNPRVPIPYKVLIWQYSDECQGDRGFDCNQTNPDIDVNADLLSKLILPPA